MSSTEFAPFLDELAALQREKLDLPRNLRKGGRAGLGEMTFDFALSRIHGEAVEAGEAWIAWRRDPTPDNLRALKLELADAANFCMLALAKVNRLAALEGQGVAPLPSVARARAKS